MLVRQLRRGISAVPTRAGRSPFVVCARITATPQCTPVRNFYFSAVNFAEKDPKQDKDGNSDNSDNSNDSNKPDKLDKSDNADSNVPQENPRSPPASDFTLSSTLSTPLFSGTHSKYTPAETHPRVSYEQPPPPPSLFQKPNTRKWPLKRILIPLVAVAAGVWTLYHIRLALSASDDSSGSRSGLSALFSSRKEPTFLDPEEFMTYVISYKEPIGPDHFLIELSPTVKGFNELSESQIYWNARRLWSIEIKQPDLQIVRRYTPLPFSVYQAPVVKGLEETKAPSVLRTYDPLKDEGRMLLYVKKYEDGELSRWLVAKPVGSRLQVRGKFTEYKFPYSPLDELPARPALGEDPLSVPADVPLDPLKDPNPENIVFFAAGTGIAPVLQMLYSPNPPRGFVDVHYSVRSRVEVPLKRYLDIAEQLGRAKIHYHVDAEGGFLSAQDIPRPVKRAEKDKWERIEAEAARVQKQLAEKAAQLAEKQAEVAQKGVPADVAPLVVEADAKAPKPSELPLGAVVEDPETQKKLVKKSPYRTALEQAEAHRNDPRDPSLALVCGPEGYVAYVAGPKDFNGPGKVGGLLKQRGWDESNVKKM